MKGFWIYKYQIVKDEERFVSIRYVKKMKYRSHIQCIRWHPTRGLLTLNFRLTICVISEDRRSDAMETIGQSSVKFADP